MSNVIRNQTRLHLGLTSGGKIDFEASDSYSFERSRSVGTVPLRGSTVSQLGGFRTKGFAMAAMSNERQDAILRGFPKRLFHTSVRTTGGVVLSGESAVSSLVLNLGLDTPVTWNLGLSVDGNETEVAAPDSFAGRPVAYHESQCDYFFGNADFLAALTPSFQGGTLTGNYTVTTTNRRFGSGVQGVSNDVDAFSFTGTMTLLPDAESDKLLTNEEGVLVIRRKDANFAYFVPMVVSAFPMTAPITGASTISAGFAQGSGVEVLAVPSNVDNDTFTGTDGTVTYSVAADAITTS